MFTAILALSCGVASATDSYLDNGRLRIGVRTDSGGCIDWFSAGKSAPNVINSFDRGRFIQQSYYGAADGSSWAGKPWSWNPVQGGSANGRPSTLLSFNNSGSQIYAKTMPKRWDTGADAPAVVMEEWIDLAGGNYAHVHYRMSYSGSSQPSRDQEMPAVFADANLGTLVFYNGPAPWTNGKLTRVTPPAANAYSALPENWAAYVGASGAGFGVYVPGVNRMTYYRAPGSAGPGGSGCSYLAPIRTMPITAGAVVEYDVYLALGTPDQMRATFAGIRSTRGGT